MRRHVVGASPIRHAVASGADHDIVRQLKLTDAPFVDKLTPNIHVGDRCLWQLIQEEDNHLIAGGHLVYAAKPEWHHTVSLTVDQRDNAVHLGGIHRCQRKDVQAPVTLCRDLLHHRCLADTHSGLGIRYGPVSITAFAVGDLAVE